MFCEYMEHLLEHELQTAHRIAFVTLRFLHCRFFLLLLAWYFHLECAHIHLAIYFTCMLVPAFPNSQIRLNWKPLKPVACKWNELLINIFIVVYLKWPKNSFVATYISLHVFIFMHEFYVDAHTRLHKCRGIVNVACT